MRTEQCTYNVQVYIPNLYCYHSIDIFFNINIYLYHLCINTIYQDRIYRWFCLDCSATIYLHAKRINRIQVIALITLLIYSFAASYFGGKRSDHPEGTVDQQQSTRYERHDHGHASEQSRRVHRGSKQNTRRA